MSTIILAQFFSKYFSNFLVSFTIHLISLNLEHLFFSKGCRKNWRMPLVFSICTNKQKKTYKTMFQKIKQMQPQYKPKKVNVDFELAAINAITEKFPNAKVQGCNQSHQPSQPRQRQVMRLNHPHHPLDRPPQASDINLL